ncbi:MAG: helix-turn-helix domain-containing protein [Anaerolinea sp.]|nr:helix-turn-helix domain-containing protein [Anaerolinea sp.]
MTTVYTHTESVFNPTTTVDREKFEARLNIFGRRLERYCRAALWERTDCPDDLEDATQVGMITLWQEYQHDPSLMDLDDRAWFKIAKRAAYNQLSRMLTQRGTPRGKKVREVTEAAFISNSEEPPLEMAERRHARKAPHLYRAEAEQADRRIDLIALLREILQSMPPQQSDRLKPVIPLIAEGYTLQEIARNLTLNFKDLCDDWSRLRDMACAYTGVPPCNPDAPVRHKQRLPEDKVEAIQAYLKAGASGHEIARILEISPRAVNNYRPLENRCNRPPELIITFEKVAEFRRLRDLGWTFKQIGAQTGYNLTTIRAYLHGNRTPNPDARSHITPEEIAEIQRLRTTGMSMPKIAQALGRSETTIRRYLPAHLLTPLRKLSAETYQAIHDLYRNGLTNCAEIARRVGCTHDSVSRILGTTRPTRTLTPAKVKRMQQLREQGLTLKQIAQKIGCDRKTVSIYLNQ